jgi:hypothetical protein
LAAGFKAVWSRLSLKENTARFTDSSGSRCNSKSSRGAAWLTLAVETATANAADKKTDVRSRFELEDKVGIAMLQGP